ncbi:MAG: phage tail protein [Roseiflexaceae bacterium]|nr:phage tail protein [Roseiflexaceae bacterium]
MGTHYVGEILIFAGNFAPAGWMLCEGQLLPISENETLFQLIGTTYGGDGQSTFALPDLRGRLPLHMGTGPNSVTYIIGEAAGVESVTLTTQQLPSHTHGVVATTALATSALPVGRVLAEGSGPTLYYADVPTVALAATAVGSVGGSQPHTNLQPYLCLNFIISLFGIYPSPT